MVEDLDRNVLSVQQQYQRYQKPQNPPTLLKLGGCDKSVNREAA